MPGTVTVACKLPHGLILRLYKMEEQEEVTLTGARRVMRAVQDSNVSVKLNGAARYMGKDPEHTIVGGAGLTYGVDADFFAEWKRRNAGEKFASDEVVFAHVKTNEVEAQARDRKALTTGFERIDIGHLPPEFKGKVQAADKPA